MKRLSLRGYCLAALMCSLPSQLSGTTILNFTGLNDGEQVLNYYGGGTGSMGSSFSDFGVSFASGAVVYVDADVGGTGNFANAPSPWGVLFSATGTIQFNVSPGFAEALRFHYVTYNGGPTGAVRVFSGANGTGQLLNSATLNAPTQNCPGNPHGSFYSCWQLVELPFSGLARSVVFETPAMMFGIDSITLPSLTLTIQTAIQSPLQTSLQSTSSPEPASLVTVAAALVGVLVLRRRRA